MKQQYSVNGLRWQRMISPHVRLWLAMYQPSNELVELNAGATMWYG